MSLSPDQASNSLKEIEKTAKRSASAYGYKTASPHFILWGIVWIAGYGGTDLSPQSAPWLWPAATLTGFALSMVIGVCQRDKKSASGYAWRYAASMIAVWAFAAATMMVLHPAKQIQVDAFIPLIIALLYCLFGIWAGWRFVIAGVLVAALTLGGFFYLTVHFELWMAIVVCGSLILAGLWLRTV